MKRDLISIKDVSLKDIEEIFKLGGDLKNNKEDFSQALNGKKLGLIFEKPSNRTRVSFEVGILELGGYAVYLGPDDIQLGKREMVKDIARVLSRYLDGIVARTFSHQDIIELAKFSSIPVINGLSDLTHPCQVLSDLFTIREKKGFLKDLNLAYIGDGNNVLHSLLFGCSKIKMHLYAANPKGYEPKKEIVRQSKDIAKTSGARIILTNSPKEAVKGADIIYTDVWTSMGQEREYEERLKAFKGFQVNSNLLKLAKPDCLVMHCLPAHRGEEITDEVFEGPNSIVFDQAENRLHVQKAILIKLLK